MFYSHCVQVNRSRFETIYYTPTSDLTNRSARCVAVADALENLWALIAWQFKSTNKIIIEKNNNNQSLYLEKKLFLNNYVIVPKSYVSKMPDFYHNKKKYHTFISIMKIQGVSQGTDTFQSLIIKKLDNLRKFFFISLKSVWNALFW